MIDPDQGLPSAARVLRVQNLEAGRVNANRVAAAVKENVEVGARTRRQQMGKVIVVYLQRRKIVMGLKRRMEKVLAVKDLMMKRLI